ncbi:cytochrome C oxidase subunit IV family protein [Aliamphritea hakodatensis]|uniref:cytochrome C oxidase subunit IV family protein n=1 Tax=Aliamphritea hakodatensis TaxID=2895352 RepID=UPI0022FD8461|nr:cytochrome C oxidase subunit IV family protein [Aliamphritea hakodatensis]
MFAALSHRVKGSAFKGYGIKNWVWLVLITLTLGSAVIAESAEPSLIITLAVAVTVGVKGWLVVDYFMELRNAHRYFRIAMNLYFVVLPMMILLVYLFPEGIANLVDLEG